MDPQTIFLPAKPLVSRKRRRPVVPSVVPLNLESAAFDAVGWVLTLTFSRAVDVAGLDLGAFVVNDGDSGYLFVGHGPVNQPDAMTVTVGMFGFEEPVEPGVSLNAGAGNGIAAVDDGVAWAGVTDLGLPFP